MIEGRRVLLVVTGGIAAYKAAEVVRLLVKGGAAVQVALTRAAAQFVAPLTFQTLSGRPVADDLFDLGQESRIGHIAVTRGADLCVVAPCSADFLGRLAAGLADDLPSAALLAAPPDLKVLLAPAMNTAMWEHPFVQRNLDALQATGRFSVIGPAIGELATASEGVGAGRMAEPAEIVSAADALLRPGDLNGVRVLVTAGPTREAIDPVRFVSNRSSGKMGFAVAEAARARGATVTLVHGPVALRAAPGIDAVAVETAAQMRDAVLARAGAVDVVVKAAAVSDYRPAETKARKIKKAAAKRGQGRARGEGGLVLELVPTPDVLADVLATRANGKPVVVGFAAETDHVLQNARAKLRRKPVDLLVANDVSEAGSGFDAETNRVTLLWPGGRVEEVPRLSKRAVADRILDHVAALLER